MTPRGRRETALGVRVGIAHHYGWAVAVTANTQHQVIDRRRIELIEAGVPVAPVHHHGGTHELHHSHEALDDAALLALVEAVRASVRRASAGSLEELSRSLDAPIESLAVRAWPPDFPDDVATQRRAPYESRADSVMYCKALAELAEERGWKVRTYDARSVEHDASARLGDRAHEVLYGPRDLLGPPWAKDHRIALAATVLST